MAFLLEKRSNLPTEDPLAAFDGDYQNFTIPDSDPNSHNVTLRIYFMNLTFIILILLVAGPFFIFILAKPELRKSPKCWLVINVLVVVLLTAIFYLPILMYNAYDFQSGVFGCHFAHLMSSFGAVHIQFSLLLLFVDRFVSFVRPKRYSDIMTPRVVRILIICQVIFEVVFILTTVYTMVKPGMDEYNGQTVCHSTGSFILYNVYLLVVHLVPLFLNVVFGIITIFCGLALCRRMRAGNENEGSLGGQAIGLIITLVILDTGLTLPDMVFVFLLSAGIKEWFIVRALTTSFFLVVNFPMMFLIPEIRSALISCCKRDKKGENMPLVKPT